MRHFHHTTLALASALSLSLLAACGRGESQSAGGEVERDGTAADSALLGPPVGDSAVRDAAGDTLAAVRGRQEAARDMGLTAKDGLDSAAAGGVRAAANDTGRNIPGVTDMRPRPGATTGPAARRP